MLESDKTDEQAMAHKNIAIIIDSLAGGGAEKVMLTLATEMVSQGHQVTFFSLKNTTQYVVPSNIGLEFPLASFNGRVRGWLNREKLAGMLQKSVNDVERVNGTFDLILVNLYESYRLASACEFKHCYYVIHNSYVQELKRERRMGPIKYFYMQRILKTLNGKDLIAVSKGVAKEVSEARLFRATSVRCIYNPFDIKHIRALATEAISDVSPNVPESEIPKRFIVHVGRAAKAKRHDILFMALKHINPEYKLVCLTSNTKKLKKLAKKYGIEERLVLPGFTENPYAWMKQADALVLSSDFEGLPTVLIESIVCATKVVSTDCPHGPREIMQGELANFLVRPRSPEALAKAVNQALKTDILLDEHPILKQVTAKQIATAYLSLAR
ncbi:glycosyltransferase [Ningiella sp. W23]|uniref:glycosyltransferase n=1 Tax=Ningiella sp. W23 TaxID=3023715 RepID=UPI003757531C